MCFCFLADYPYAVKDFTHLNRVKEAALLFIRSLPVGAHFNIIRFGSHNDTLFTNATLPDVYDEQTAKQAEAFINSTAANLDVTELFVPLTYLKNHPPSNGRAQQIFLWVGLDVSNPDEVGH